MRMNFGITAQGPQNDFGNALLQGMRLKGLKGEIDQRNALAAAMQQHGAGALSGDQNALNALAAVGPQGFQVASQSRAQHAAEALREREFAAQQADRQARLGLARQAGARAASEHAARMSALELQKEQAESLKQAAAAREAMQRGPEAWERWNDQFPEFENVAFDDAPMAISMIDGVVSELEKYKPQTDIGKLNQDLEQGAITQDQFDAVSNPGPDFDVEQGLRKEYTALPQVKEFQGQATAYSRMIESAADPSAAGDMALIFNYMKLLDPGSTVREGEFATAQNAGSIPQRIMARYNAVLNGESLEQAQRDDFLDRATRLYKGAEAKYSHLEDQYSDIVTGQGLDPARTLPNFRHIDRTPDGGDEQGSETPVQIKSGGEYNTLPSGTLFRDPEGNIRRKP